MTEPREPTLLELEREDPFAPHDPGCRCWPHVSQRAAIEAATQAATAEYRAARHSTGSSATAEDLRAAVELADARIDALETNPDGTVAEYALSATDWNRIVAIARGSKSDAAERAIAPFRAARSLSDEPAGLRELRELSEAASPGGWDIERGSIAWMIREYPGGPQVGNTILTEDAEFIVAAVNYVRARIQEAE